MTAYIGELAALTTALCWSFTAVFFTFAGRRLGSVVVNRVRLLLALALLLGAHWLFQGEVLPSGAEPRHWFWLGLSGVAGLVLGDAFLFQSYLWLGPRLGMLMMSLAPVLAALLAQVFLGERLRGVQWLGILVAVGGIAMVVLGRYRPFGNATSVQDYRRGILFGVGAASGQAVGLVLAKPGLQGSFSALSGNLIRMLAAVLILWGATILFGRAGDTFRRLIEQRRAMLPILGGTVTGPFLGVWLSLIAVQQTSVGVASTLMALPPVILLPVGYFQSNERIGPRAVVGTLIAIGGVALLFSK